jgi:DNA-binding FadR family transcriptional regulator
MSSALTSKEKPLELEASGFITGGLTPSGLATKGKSQALNERLAALAVSLGPNHRMPTVAQLCESLDVSSRTLNFALRELEQQGVIARRNGIGLFVAPTVRERVARRDE